MDIWNKVGDKMQTITRIEEDMYIMKNYEFLFKEGYFAVYFMTNLLNIFSISLTFLKGEVISKSMT